MAVTYLDSTRSARMARAHGDPAADLLDKINECRLSKSSEMSRFADLADRYDNLYYPNIINKDGGADHWPNHESAKTVGRVHISVNVYPAYVDIPASLQSVEPIENILSKTPENPNMRLLAASIERVYFGWKDLIEFEVKAHKACVVKALYGRTAARLYWDDDKGYPCVTVVDQPRNLTLGWSSQNYERLDWALYAYYISVNEAIETFGVDVDTIDVREGNQTIRLPFVRAGGSDHSDPIQQNTRYTTRDWLNDAFQIECVDYWYRKPKQGASITLGEKTEMETWNAIFVGNVLVKDMPHPEYDGKLPYVPLFNTYIPGVPDGRSEYYDIEQIIREKEERLSAGGQMIQKSISGQFWQLTGSEAPDVVPSGVQPKENKVVAPGPGNRIEKIEPFMPEFQLEQYLSRLDRELVDVSGLNDLLRGLAPASVMSSSKAINALVANYESRIRMKRDLFYSWRSQVWELAKTIWAAKRPEMKLAFDTVTPIDVKAPSITPRDDLETATLALNLLNGKVWSLARAQDYTGVDDPEGEQNLIRKDRTDASLFPADVLQMASLMATMQQLGMQQQQAQMAAQQQGGAGAAMAQGQAAQGQQAGGYLGQPMMNGTGEGIATPPEALPPGAPEAGGLPPSGPGQNFSAQTQVTDQGAQSRLLLQQPIAPPQGPSGGGGGSY